MLFETRTRHLEVCLELVGLAVLRRGLELGNLLRDGLLNSGLEFSSVSKLKKHLKPDKHGGEEDGLDEIVQQGRGATLEDPMTDELRDPGHDMNTKGDLEGCGGITEVP